MSYHAPAAGRIDVSLAAFGTRVQVIVADRSPTLDRVELSATLAAWFAMVDQMFNPWRADSELRRAGGPRNLMLDQVFALCDLMRAETGGLFDTHWAAAVPRDRRTSVPAIDPDPTGLVKGWALEMAARRLHRHGLRRFLLNAGGDVLTRAELDDPPWRVGIEDPDRPGFTAGTVTLHAGAVATSGRYRRDWQVFHPVTGEPAQARTATVVGPDLTRADAYATAALIDPRPAARTGWAPHYQLLDAPASLTATPWIPPSPAVDRPGAGRHPGRRETLMETR